jgi:hypothetical protein
MAACQEWLPTPVRRRLALARLGFHYDCHAGAWCRDGDGLGIDEETLDAMDDHAFHRLVHELVGEEHCMANKVVANRSFEYGPPSGGHALDRGEIFELGGFTHDQLLLDKYSIRPLTESCQVVRCEVCGRAFVEGLPEHMSKRHGPQEAA